MLVIFIVDKISINNNTIIFVFIFKFYNLNIILWKKI